MGRQGLSPLVGPQGLLGLKAQKSYSGLALVLVQLAPTCAAEAMPGLNSAQGCFSGLAVTNQLGCLEQVPHLQARLP